MSELVWMAADDTRELEELLERPLPDRDRAPQAAFSIPEKTAARSLQPLQGTHDLLRHRDRDGDIRLPPPPGDLIPAEHPRFQAHGVADREARPPQDQDKGFQQFPSPFRTVRIELGRPENLLPLVLLERKHLGAFLFGGFSNFAGLLPIHPRSWENRKNVRNRSSFFRAEMPFTF